MARWQVDVRRPSIHFSRDCVSLSIPLVWCQLQGVIACVNGPNPSAAEYSTTPPLTLVYDTLPPSMVTDTVALANATLFPGNVVTISYSEDLLCTRPFAFQVQLVQFVTVGNVSSTQVLYDSGSSQSDTALPLRCSGPDIHLLIPRTIGQRLSLPTTIGIRMAGVTDLYFNSNSGALTLSVQMLSD